MTTVWKNATTQIFFSEQESSCEVRIVKSEIVVSYRVGARLVSYEGREVAPGHFELTAPKIRGRATLHRAPNSDWLEGHWVEGEVEGMWRLHIGEKKSKTGA